MCKENNIKIILASKSRDRAELFKLAKIKIDIIPSAIDEEPLKKKFPNPYQLVKELAKEKGYAVAKRIIFDSIGKSSNKKTFPHEISYKFAHEGKDIIIISADTMVVINNNTIGKAKNKDHAIEILTRLSGKIHELITGVCLLYIPRTMLTDQNKNAEHRDNSLSNLKQIIFMDSTKVHFQNLTREEIADYLSNSDEYKGRAGSYSLREAASLFIDYVEGSPTNVLGLSMGKIRANLKNWGIDLLKFVGK